MKRCLILGCSQKKNSAPGKLSAIDRYDGPPFKVLHRFLTDVPPIDPRKDNLDIFILSAKFGLISGETPIPDYDKRMTKQLAMDLHESVLQTFRQQIGGVAYQELFISMGQTYLIALDGFEQHLASDCRVIISGGGSGRKLSELKTWLTAEAPAPTQLTLSVAASNGRGGLRGTVRGYATIRGVTITLSPEEVYQNGRTALKTDSTNAFNFRNWYVEIDEVRVSPKWLVQQLSGVPVSDFDASAARRVLKGLGIPIYRKQ